MGDGKLDIFLDSGAFSAHTKGLEIDIYDYIKFIKEFGSHLEVYANLDVIGNPAATLKNQKIMEKEGLSPLPCYHFGEPVRYLEYYLERYEYMALGGMVGRKTADLIGWLDVLYADYLTDEKGMPRIKIHGFGITGLKVLKRYPWYSVDSTAWVVASRMGRILIPMRAQDGKSWDFLRAPMILTVSLRGQKMAGVSNNLGCLDGLGKMARKRADRYIEERGHVWGRSEFKEEDRDNYELAEGEKWVAGQKHVDRDLVEIIHEEGICNSYLKRDHICVSYFMDLQAALPEFPWAFKIKASRGFGLL